MGLSGPRQKQKIGNDPRNLTWSDNATRFGHEYLSKLGWTSASGLGAEMNGTTRHIPVAQKLNMLGIGADNRDGPEAIAWKQNQDFEGVLKRLNSSSDLLEKPSCAPVAPLTVEPSASSTIDNEETLPSQSKVRKEKKKIAEKVLLEPSDLSSRTATGKPAIRLAHRARNRAAKSMVGLSAAAMAEVLGESSTPVTPDTAPGAATPRPVLTPISDVQDPLITTSLISMADYFKSKLQNKATKASDNPEPAASTHANPFEAEPTDHAETNGERKRKGRQKDDGVSEERFPSSASQLPSAGDNGSELEGTPRKKKKRTRITE